jgi:tetratricopeptide (TPR) repeat protein
LIVGRFEWCDDFAAARNHAHSLATGDVHCWTDLDERVIDGEYLRSLATRFAERPQLRFIAALHSTATEWKPKLIRPPVRWTGMTMEVPEEIPGQAHAPGEVETTQLVSWSHTRTVPHGRRDLEIALKWAAKEPDNWGAWMAAADEARGLEEWQLAIDYGDRALALASDAAEMSHARAYILGGQARAALAVDDFVTAERLSFQAISEHERAESWLLLALCANGRGQYGEALHYATTAGSLALTDEIRAAAEGVAALARWRLLLVHVAAAAR